MLLVRPSQEQRAEFLQRLLPSRTFGLDERLFRKLVHLNGDLRLAVAFRAEPDLEAGAVCAPRPAEVFVLFAFTASSLMDGFHPAFF